jgi:DNA-directed RNA polymerase specialized sigma24 family protein
MRRIKGYPPEKILAIIDEISSYLSPYFVFGYYDREDIEQEARIEGLNALNRYKPGKGAGLETFLQRHIRNRLLNLKRDKLMRLDSPCKDCDGKRGGRCINYVNRNSCEPWYLWHIRNGDKRNLMEPVSEDIDNMITSKLPPVSEEYDKKELFDIVSKEIPVDMRKDFLKLTEGAPVLKFRKDKLMEKIKEIIGNYYGESDWESQTAQKELV